MELIYVAAMCVAYVQKISIVYFNWRKKDEEERAESREQNT